MPSLCRLPEKLACGDGLQYDRYNITYIKPMYRELNEDNKNAVVKKPVQQEEHIQKERPAGPAL